MVGKFICQILFDYSPLTHHFTSSYPAASFYMPHGHKTRLPTHRSPRTHQRRGVNEIWRLFVEESQVEMRWELELYLFSNFSISPLLVDCCCCANKQHATINHPKFKTSTIKIRTHNNQPSDGWCFILCLRIVSCLCLSHFYFGPIWLSQPTFISSDTCLEVESNYGKYRWVISVYFPSRKNKL
jgi:hypothetical protein